MSNTLNPARKAHTKKQIDVWALKNDRGLYLLLC